MAHISCAVGIRNAMLRNHVESQMCSVLTFKTFRNTLPFKNTHLKATIVFRAVLRGILTGSKCVAFFYFFGLTSDWLIQKNVLVTFCVAAARKKKYYDPIHRVLLLFSCSHCLIQNTFW